VVPRGSSMTGFLLGVASSIVASGLLVAISWIFSSKTRSWLSGLLGYLTGAGSFHLYPTQIGAHKELVAALKRARWVRILAARGNELVQGTLDDLWPRVGRVQDVKIVLPDPERTDEWSWLTHHEGEAAAYDPGFGPNLLADQVRTNLEYLRQRTQDMRNVHIESADFPTVARVVITDRQAFLTIYSEDKHGRDAPCIVCDTSSPIYDFAVRLFNMAWRVVESQKQTMPPLNTSSSDRLTQTPGSA
jgi:hypothetical protein